MQTDETTGKLYSILIQLDKRQDELAATEAAVTRYSAPAPVLGHRTPVTPQRAEADRLSTAS